MPMGCMKKECPPQTQEKGCSYKKRMLVNLISKQYKIKSCICFTFYRMALLGETTGEI